MKRLSHHVIFVTGAASDIGVAVAKRCKSEGATVICTVINTLK